MVFEPSQEITGMFEIEDWRFFTFWGEKLVEWADILQVFAGSGRWGERNYELGMMNYEFWRGFW